MAEKMITLTEAFRVLLRAGYPQRPALADKIQSHLYFHYAPIDKSTGRRVDAEAQAADDALALLRGAIVSQSIRLRGRLGDNLPADIDPTEVTGNGISVFNNALEVYQPSTNISPFRMLRTYLNVHCYEHEIKSILNIGLPKRVGQRPKADWDAVETALRIEIKSRGMIGPDNDPDWQRKADVERWVSKILDERHEGVGESTVRDRVSRMLESIEAGN